MAITRDSLKDRIVKITLLAERRLYERIEHEKWKEKHFYPVLEALKAGKAVHGLPEGTEVEWIVEHTNPRQAAEPETDGSDHGAADADPGDCTSAADPRFRH